MGIDLKSGDLVFFDTAPFIYFFEESPDYFPALSAFFDRLYETGAQVMTSMITYIELATHPARQGKERIVRKYRDYLSNSENISLFPLDLTIADQAVRLRARYGLKIPDAIQLGTAVACGADFVVTNDKAWLRFEEADVVLVQDI